MCNEVFVLIFQFTCLPHRSSHSIVVSEHTLCCIWCDFDCIAVSSCKWLPFKRFTHCHTLVIFNVIIFKLSVDSVRCVASFCCCLLLLPRFKLYSLLRVLFIAQFHSITCVFRAFFSLSQYVVVVFFSSSSCLFVSFSCSLPPYYTK